jgi:MFS family permease
MTRAVERPRAGRRDRTARRAAWGGYGRYPLLILALLGFVEALERRVLPAVITLVQDDLGFSDFQAGLLDSALIVAALVVAVPAGVLADRLDRRKFLGIAVAVWAALSAVTSQVRTFGQLLVMRTALGAGDAINDPAAQSMVADYYPPAVRGRAYGIQRVTPTLGAGIGLAVGAALGAAFGWRVALASMALPGFVVALLLWRLHEPARGASESPVPVPGANAADAVAAPGPATSTAVSALTTRARVRLLLRIRSLRALLLATSVTTGILGAVAFWGVAYHQRSNGLDLTTAGVVAGVPVLLGAIGGSLGGGWLVDRLRGRVRGAPLVVAALMSGAGAVIFTIGFVDGLPLYTVRVPLHALAVGLLVGALPGTTTMTSEVVPAALRGTAFGLLKLSANVLAAIVPPLVGAIADANQIVDADGEEVGDLAFAFRVTIPFILVASVLLLRGRRWVEDEVAAARLTTSVPSA